MSKRTESIVVWILIVVVCAGLLFLLVAGEFGRVKIGKAAAPDTVLPTVYKFGASQIVVHWVLIPDGFAGVPGVIYISGANDYEQDVVLHPMGGGWYEGTIQPVPVTGLYYLSYGFFRSGNEVYPVADLPGDPNWITLYRTFIPAVTK